MLIMGAKATHNADHRFKRPAGYSFWTFFAIHEGASCFCRRGVEHVCEADCGYLIPPDHEYQVRTGRPGRPWTETYILFEPAPQWLELLEWAPSPSGLRVLDLRPQPAALLAFRQSLAWLEHVLTLRDGQWQGLRVNAFERVLLLAAHYGSHLPQSGRDPRVREVVRLITQDLSRPMSAQSLAERVHLSPVHLAALFRREMGIALMRFVEQQRMSRARELLLTTQMSVKQVAVATGYGNPLHFSTRFRLTAGQSPREYRRAPGPAAGMQNRD